MAFSKPIVVGCEWGTDRQLRGCKANFDEAFGGTGRCGVIVSEHTLKANWRAARLRASCRMSGLAGRSVIAM